MTPPFKNERILALDVARIVACVFICAEHLFHYSGITYLTADMTSFADDPIAGYVFSFFEFETPIFLMTSGALILPLKTSTSAFLKKRFTNIGIPMIVWTILYILPMLQFNTPERAHLLLVQAPFMPSINGGFWFLYTLFGLYMLSPILSGWLKACSQKEVKWYLIFWCLVSMFPYASHVSGAEINITSPFYYFTGYVGFYILGYYIRTYHLHVSTSQVIAVVLAYLCIDLAMPWFEYFIGMKEITGAINTNFGNIVRCTAIFVVIFYFCSRYKSTPFISTLSKLTFGVYLINEMMNLGISRLDILPQSTPYLRLAVASLMLITVSFTFVYLVSYLPGSKYIVAYHHK